MEYSYSFSEEIQQDWVWTETMPTQPEIEAYLNFVADRLDLRRDIRLDTSVVAMTFDEDACERLSDTATGEQFAAPFVVAASGILSVPLEPDIAGMATFDGASLYTSQWLRLHRHARRRHRNQLTSRCFSARPPTRCPGRCARSSRVSSTS